jgi:hypothetical protein
MATERFDGRREATRVTGSNGSTNLAQVSGSRIRSSPATPAGVRRTPGRRTAITRKRFGESPRALRALRSSVFFV